MDCLLCSTSLPLGQGSTSNFNLKKENEFLQLSENLSQSLCQLLDLPLIPFLDYFLQPTISFCAHCVDVISNVADLFEQIEQLRIRIRQSRGQVQNSITQALEQQAKNSDKILGLDSASALDDQISTKSLRHEIINFSNNPNNSFANPFVKAEAESESFDDHDAHSDLCISPLPGIDTDSPINASYIEVQNNRILRVSLQKLDDEDIKNTIQVIRNEARMKRLRKPQIDGDKPEPDSDSSGPIFSDSEKSRHKKRRKRRKITTTQILEVSISCTFPDCSKLFTTTSARVRHLKRIHKVVHPYLCSYCSKPCKTQWDLDTHTRVHTGETPFVCEVCGKGFRSARYLEGHQTIHTGEGRVACNDCGKTFRNKHSMLSHALAHRGEKTFMCEFCPRAYTTKENLTNHQVKVHPEGEGVEKLKCQYCPKIFGDTIYLTRHEKKHGEEFKLECTVCKFRGETPYRLKYHMLKHTDEKTIQCTEPGCDKTFRYKSQYIIHKRDHTGERPYVCGTCQRAFKDRSHLRRHEAALHSDLKPFMCSLCGERFPLRKYLNRHTEKHRSGKILPKIDDETNQEIEVDPIQIPNAIQKQMQPIEIEQNQNENENDNLNESLSLSLLD